MNLQIRKTLAFNRWSKFDEFGVGVFTGFPGGSVVKNPSANSGDTRDVGLIPGLGRSPGEGNSNPLQYFLPEKSHGQRNWVGSSPKGCKESDTTEL